ncbi:hypothetical protein L6164_035895 [Bauhinia variegata]|uniref:Uncharacterized protein n=1 Tax=Bauhinia variegata TaxID=167791 RepID=A0ACB9KFC8_BAUVA|nr:hypothetical protein L6164_035895 [Bauhinia variegata]
MAMYSNNSSFGVPSRSNPNARNSETSDPMRRSFCGNPFPKPSIIANPRSFNPNTPANSPSDFPRRNSFGVRESIGSFRDLDDKENGKDQNMKPAKVRSPASSLKGTKNFMSPTISASSKITVSPRKKVLIERNEPARASISSTDGKSPVHEVTMAEPMEGSDLKPGIDLDKKKFEALLESGPKPGVRKVTFAVPLEDSDLKTGDGLGEQNLEASYGRFAEEETKEDSDISSVISEDLKVEPVFDTLVAFNPKNETELPFETVTQEPDCVNLDPTFKLSPTPPPSSSTSTSLAPLDADPLMPPYDPKTNYLSPRPQFLHYRPKPRLSEGRYCVTPEESFISGSFSDTEVTEETQSEDSQRESEDISSDEPVEEEDEGHISEPSPTERLISKDSVEAEQMPKPRFFTRFKAIALLLLISVACISMSVTNSPVIDPSMFEELSIFSKIHEPSDFFDFAKANFDGFSEFAKANFDSVTEFAKANSDGLARNVRIWFCNFMSSISELISNFGGVHDLAPLHYYNLSVLHEDVSVYQYPIFSHSEREVGDNLQLDSSLPNNEDNGAEIEIDDDIEDISTEYDSAYEEHFPQDMEVTASVETVSDASEDEEVLESQQTTTMEPSESRQALQQADVREPNHIKSNVDFTHQPGSGASKLDIEAFEASNQALEIDADINAEEVMNNVDQKNQLESNSEVAEILVEVYDDATGDIQPVEAEAISVDAAFRENEPRSEAVDLPQYMLLYVLLFLSLIATAAFNYSRKYNRSTKVATSMEQPQFSKTLHTSVPKEQISLDKSSLRNGPTEMDVLGESCPSEISSFQKSSSYVRKETRELNEAQSIEKKPKKSNRRESLASSDYSMGSPTSYGSFTTYEKIPSKHRHGDENTITPVRRSSRIRNQATSPL